MQTNWLMQRLLGDGAPLRNPGVLSGNLAEILRDGISLVDGCLVLGKPDAVPRLDGVRATIKDKTGYECFVNHIHFKERGSAAAIRQAVAFCTRVSADAVRVAPTRSLRFIISNDGEDWTVRFHALRPHESWVSDDLEKYAEEAVLVLDSTEL